MVTIVNYKPIQNENGEQFFGLEVQGGIEAVRSQETDRMYFTARKATVACTFNEVTCQTLIGEKMPGKIQKVETEPYEYIIPGTEEVITMDYRYEYISEEDSIVQDNVVLEEELVM
jgi:hypothetical protein